MEKIQNATKKIEDIESSKEFKSKMAAQRKNKVMISLYLGNTTRHCSLDELKRFYHQINTT